MKFDLKRPCPQCPFRCDIPGYLREERAEEIAESLLHGQHSFPCHKTLDHDDEGDAIRTDDEQHCAGAAIMLEKMERPNQMMRIAERVGFYDAQALDMDAPVVDDADEFISHHADAEHNRSLGRPVQ